MNIYRVAYVDESEIDIRRFQRYSRNYFDVFPLQPLKDKNETISIILDNAVQAVIADFDLSEQDETVKYNGAQLISGILEQREGLPVFILTSFEGDAVSKGDDVNIVYEKSEIGNGVKFLERVKTQIDKYLFRIESSERRLIYLLSEREKRTLDAFEEDEIIKLDSYIESVIDKRLKIPDILRMKNESSNILELLKKVDNLTKKIEGKI